MATAFLIDFSASAPSSVQRRMAKYVCYHFRPGDIVIGFDVWASHIPFQGNPTITDILKQAEVFRGGTNPLEAIKLAKQKDPGCHIKILSDGEFGGISVPYELIKY